MTTQQQQADPSPGGPLVPVGGMAPAGFSPPAPLAPEIQYNASGQPTGALLDSVTGLPVISPASVSPYMGCLASGFRYATAFAAGNKQANTRTYHVAQVQIASPVLVLPGFYGADLPYGAATTVTASIETTSGQFFQAKFSGSTSGTIPNGGLLLSDPIPAFIPRGAGFYIRTFQQCAAGLPYSQAFDIAADGGGTFNEATAFAASGAADLTLGGAVTASAGTLGLCPAALIGITNAPSCMLIGDSRLWGSVDNTPVAGNYAIGELQRMFGSAIAWSSFGNPSETALSYSASTLRKQLHQFFSHIFSQYGTNDVQQSASTSAQLIGYQQTIQAFNTYAKFIPCTIAPRTTSTDTWATAGNQTPVAGDANRAAYNTALRSNSTGLGFNGFVEISAPVEVNAANILTLNGGRWISNGVANTYTTDGVHETKAANLLIQASNAVVTANINR